MQAVRANGPGVHAQLHRWRDELPAWCLPPTGWTALVGLAERVDHGEMAEVELEIQRTVPAPVAEVFARLADIEGHNRWVPGKGSIFRSSRQTSPGPVGVGTTFEDDTRLGRTPGEVVEHAAPHRIVYHWWDATSSGRIKMEGWPGYTLEAVGERETLVRHDARLRANGIYALGKPLLRVLARRERTATLEALVRSFEKSDG
jgi:uncharacterized protein YndB with AHSA1/START domain